MPPINLNPEPTRRVRVRRADPDSDLSWIYGYEGLSFNVSDSGSDWAYHCDEGTYLMDKVLCDDLGQSHDVHYTQHIEGKEHSHQLVCHTCMAQLELSRFMPRTLQEQIREFLREHGTPQEWRFEQWVLRKEKRTPDHTAKVGTITRDELMAALEDSGFDEIDIERVVSKLPKRIHAKAEAA